MLKKRGAGVLFHISSMPSPYGVGVFDNYTKEFIDKISDMGFSYWQVLPFSQIDSANSPYCSTSAFAGNYIFIDPQKLFEMNLVSKEDVEKNIYYGSEYTADYEFAKLARYRLLKTAFNNIDDNIKKEIDEFEKDSPWLDDYALFMAVKQAEDSKPWWLWSEENKRYKKCKENKDKYKDSIEFWKFVQYIFFKQWKEIKTYANEKGVAIIGDMPIYVAMDSVDVWSNLPLFLIDDKTLKPQKVAGVPPDYFCEDGQLWGNPIYNWEKMKEDGYKWWINRIENSNKMFDVIRIDHFRAFASYWEIPADAKTAKEGVWKDGPKMDLFNAVKEKLPNVPIIAEDLGVFGQDVIDLLDDTGFPGMKVIQFGFDPNSDSSHLPHNAVQNSVNYVGTHDNNTILGWLWEANENERRFALDYIGFEGDNWGDGGYYSKSCRKVIEAVWKSSSNTAIIALQDMCGFGSDARMNIPGVPEKNWRFRTTKDTINSIDKDYFKKINSVYRRMYKAFD